MQLTDEPRSLSGKPSLLLDSLRIFAALTVLYGHAFDHWNPPLHGEYSFLYNLAHACVIVFFVLSGYVIAHTTNRNHRGSLHYALARLSRLYSIVLPAIVITGCIQFVVSEVAPLLNQLYSRGNSFPRYIISSLFLNEVWFYSASPPINSPLWSLSYEFWYYVIFGFFFFRKNNSLTGFILPILSCLIAGPKILIMMPIWLSGNYAYRIRRPNLSTEASWLLIVAGFIFVACLIVFLPYIPSQVGTPPLFWAAQFVTDWIIGFFLAIVLWLLPTNKKVVKTSEAKWVKLVRQFADLTFPIYVLHMPLLIFYRALFGTQLHNKLQMFTALFSALFISAGVGILLEKYRYRWTILFNNLLTYFKMILKKISKQVKIPN